MFEERRQLVGKWVSSHGCNTFLSPPVQHAKWAVMHRFLPVSHLTEKLDTNNAYVEKCQKVLFSQHANLHLIV